MERKKILFVCYGNACRSPMAEYIVNNKHSELAIAESAGVHPNLPNILLDSPTIQVMSEVGIDISQHKPRHIHAANGSFDLIINMSPMPNSALKAFSYLSIQGTEWIFWDVPDPRAQPIGTYTRVRDLLAEKIAQLLENKA